MTANQVETLLQRSALRSAVTNHHYSLVEVITVCYLSYVRQTILLTSYTKVIVSISGGGKDMDLPNIVL